jgi:polysaccharide export outer membrane protein
MVIGVESAHNRNSGVMDKISDVTVRLLAGVILCFCSVSQCGAQTQNAPPSELVQYIKQAAKLGLKEAQIQQNALKEGWPSATISDALAYVRTSAESSGASAKPRGKRNAEKGGAHSSVQVATDIPAAKAAIRSIDATPASATYDVGQNTTSRTQDEYRIGAGDVLQVSVWKEPEASAPSTVVRPDGKIGLPLLKEIEVAGLTTKEAEKAIAERLSSYIPGADVTVIVAGINSKKIYIVGAVKKEGPIPYTYRMTVMQALSEAGGLTDYAKRKKIYVLRAQNGKQYRLPFDYDSVLRGEHMELNVMLVPSDTLVVPY